MFEMVLTCTEFCSCKVSVIWNHNSGVFFNVFSPNTGLFCLCLHVLIVFQVGFSHRVLCKSTALSGDEANWRLSRLPLLFSQIPPWQCRCRARPCFPWTSGWESGGCALVRTRRSSPLCTRLYSSRRSPLSPAPSPNSNYTSTSG